MTRRETLQNALNCVYGDREQDYGSPETNFKAIAEFWTTYLRTKNVSPNADVCILPEDVAAMLILLKVVRIMTGSSKADNWIDIAGYAACGAEVESGEK